MGRKRQGLPEGAPDGAELAERLRAYARGVQRVTVSLARRMGIPPTDVWALEHLLNAGPLGPVELGRRLGIRSASATTLVDRLERAGHAERTRPLGDRRRLAVVATPVAADAAGAAFAPLGAALEGAAAGMTAAERTTVARYLDRVIAALDAYSAPGEG